MYETDLFLIQQERTWIWHRESFILCCKNNPRQKRTDPAPGGRGGILSKHASLVRQGPVWRLRKDREACGSVLWDGESPEGKGGWGERSVYVCERERGRERKSEI